MICDVRERLGFLGVEVSDHSLDIISRGVLNRIKSECNTEKIEGDLRGAAIDLICAEYLLSFEADNIKQISEGDTSVTFWEGKAGSLIHLYKSRGRIPFPLTGA